MKMEQQNQNLMEEQRADYKTYEAKGSHKEIGRITALQSPSVIGPKRSEMTAEQVRYAEQCLSVVSRIFPEIIEEFAGYAEAFDLRLEDILYHFTLGVEGGCSSVAIRTEQGMVVARNYDFFYWENRRHLIFTQPDRGLSHVGMHTGLVGSRHEGMNEAGLFVNFNGAGEHPDPAPVGMSFHLVVRYLLEKCRDAKEARDAILDLPLKEPKSYLVADAKEAFVVEAHHARKRVREMENGVLAMTNHYVHPEMTELCRGWNNSRRRYDALVRGASTIQRHAAPLQGLEELMAQHGAPLCGHDDGLATFWSCTADISHRDIYYALGAPCRTPFKKYFEFA
jgi:predicted choloylglycine hydrolase